MLINLAKEVLRGGQSLIRSFAAPVQCRGEVHADPLTEEIHERQACLRFGVTMLGQRQPEPLGGGEVPAIVGRRSVLVVAGGGRAGGEQDCCEHDD